MTSADQAAAREEAAEPRSDRWQLLVGAFIALGCLVTVGYAVAETFWG